MKQSERDRVNEEMLRKYGEINSKYGLSEVTTLEDALNLDIETGEHMRLNLSALDRIIVKWQTKKLKGELKWLICSGRIILV